MSDLRERVPGHSLIDELLRQWDLGAIHVNPQNDRVVIDEDAEGWYRGVIGEREVGDILAELDDRWTVLHSVPVGAGRSDIDHIAIGPPGVFTINTKFSPGKNVWVAGRGMYVGGSKQPYTLNAIAEARRASTLLTNRAGFTVPVTGMVVFVDPGHMTYKAPVRGGDLDPVVQVLSDDKLLAALDASAEFSDEQVAAIAEVAARPDTWAHTVVPSSAGDHILREFMALEDAVGPRLSMPRTHAVAAPAARSAATGSTNRRPVAKASSGRKPRRSRLERLFAELALPLAGLVALWAWYSNFISK